MLRLHIGFRRIRNILLYTSSVTPMACHLLLKEKALTSASIKQLDKSEFEDRTIPSADLTIDTALARIACRGIPADKLEFATVVLFAQACYDKKKQKW